MTVAIDRSEAARLLCRKLAREVAGIAPPGIGLWEPAWSGVAAASDRFLDLLHQWEQTGDEDILPELRRAYFQVISAWRSAAGRYQEAAHA